MQSRDFTVALDLVRTGKVLQVVADALGPEGFLPRGYPKRGVDRNEWGGWHAWRPGGYRFVCLTRLHSRHEPPFGASIAMTNDVEWYFGVSCATCGRPILIAHDWSRGRSQWGGYQDIEVQCQFLHCSSHLQHHHPSHVRRFRVGEYPVVPE